MIDTYTLGAYWGAREETIQQCSEKVYKYMVAVSGIHPFFSKWYKKGYSRNKALKNPISLSIESINELLLEGRNRNDTNNEIISDLGYRIPIWNGEKSKDAASLSITCGGYSKVPGVGGNHIVFDFPESWPEIADVNITASLLRCTVDIWKPEWAGVYSLDAMISTKTPPVLDWMIYLSDGRKIISDKVRIDKMNNGGCLYVLSDLPPKYDDNNHQALVENIRSKLFL